MCGSLIEVSSRGCLNALALLVVIASCRGPVEPHPARPYPRPGQQEAPGGVPYATTEKATPESRPPPSPATRPRSNGTALDEAAAAQERGKVALFANRYAEAITEFERAYQLDPLNVQNSINLALAYFQAGKFEPALTLSRRLFAMQMDLGKRRKVAIIAGHALSNCVSQAGGCSSTPLSDEELARLDVEGQALLESNRREEAHVLFLRAYAYSGKPRPLLRIATFEYVTNDYKDALLHARTALDGFSDKSSPLFKEAQILVETIEKECAAQKRTCR